MRSMMQNCNFYSIYRDEVHNIFLFHDDGVLGIHSWRFFLLFPLQAFLMSSSIMLRDIRSRSGLLDGSVGSTVHKVGSVGNYLIRVGSLSVYRKYYLFSNRGIRNTLRCQTICLHLLSGENKHS